MNIILNHVDDVGGLAIISTLTKHTVDPTLKLQSAPNVCQDPFKKVDVAPLSTELC